MAFTIKYLPKYTKGNFRTLTGSIWYTPRINGRPAAMLPKDAPAEELKLLALIIGYHVFNLHVLECTLEEFENIIKNEVIPTKNKNLHV